MDTRTYGDMHNYIRTHVHTITIRTYIHMNANTHTSTYTHRLAERTKFSVDILFPLTLAAGGKNSNSDIVQDD